MNNIVFEKEEYEKLMLTLGLLEDDETALEDKSIFFNAWGFGQQEGDFDCATTTVNK